MVRPAKLLLSALAPVFALAATPSCPKQNDFILETREPSYVKFQVPCRDCVLGPNQQALEHLVFDLQVFKSSDPCSSRNVVINGQPLSPESPDPTVWNEEHLQLHDASNSFQVTAQWALQCLSRATESADEDGPSITVQSLLISIKQIEERHVKDGTGFVFTFRQDPSPQIIRVDLTSGLTEDDHHTAWLDWIDPPQSSRIEPSSANDEAQSHGIQVHDLEAELSQLKTQLKHLESQVKEKENRLSAKLKDGLAHWKQEIKDCNGFSCALNAIFHRAKLALRIASLKAKSAWRIHMSHHHHGPQTRLGSHCHSLQTRPLFPPEDPSHTTSRPIPIPSGPTRHPLAHLFKHAHHHLDNAQLKALLASSIVLLIVISVILHIRRRKRRESPRRREFRRHVREVRRQCRRLRRERHRKHMEEWRKWWRGLWQDRQTVDDEEKHARVEDQESRLEGVMQNEIRRMREAARAVSSLVSGSSDTDSSPEMTVSPQAGDFALPMRRQSSLPDYQSELGDAPPTYDDFDERWVDQMVADGFQYTPSGTIGTPVSSVFPTSIPSDDSSDDENQKQEV